MASLLHVGGMQPDATGSGCVPLFVGYVWDGGWPIAAMSGLVEAWFRDVGWRGGMTRVVSDLATSIRRPSCLKTPRQVSVSIPLASTARSCADLAAVRCGRPGGSRCRPGGGTVTITESDRISGHRTIGQPPNAD